MIRNRSIQTLEPSAKGQSEYGLSPVGSNKDMIGGNIAQIETQRKRVRDILDGNLKEKKTIAAIEVEELKQYGSMS